MTQNERKITPIWKKIIFGLLTLILFCIQIYVFVLMFQLSYSREINIIVYLFIEIYGLSLVIFIIHKPISTSYKLTWSILILFLPLPFTLLYYLNYTGRMLPRYKQKKIAEVIHQYNIDNKLIEELEKIDSTAAKHAKVVKSNTNYPLYNNTKYTFLEDGFIKFNDLIKEIQNAKKYIFIETFIISDGYLIEELLKELVKKGEAGVEIKIIYDDLGSKANLKKKTISKFTQIKNCQIVNYNPLGLNINPAFNYRDHRKITIIDGRIAYCGGDNFADEYIHKKERFGFWRDNCGKYEGNAVKSFIALFIEMWYMSTKEVLKIEDYFANTQKLVTNSYIMPFGDGPSDNANAGYDTFKSLINSADTNLHISTPYLVIDDAMLESIALAARSGVDVKLLMPGIPDKKSAFYLARFHYKQILKAGGKIYEYTKGFNHAKNIIVDKKYAFIGTINMDYRSLFLHYECGALILLDKEIEKMDEDFIKACEESKEITLEDLKKRPWYQKLFAYIFYLFSPMF